MASLKWDPNAQPKILSHEGAMAITWGQLGPSPNSEPIAISLYGPDPSQAKYAFVERLLTDRSGTKPAMIANRSSQEMLSAVGNDLGGIAFHSVARGRPTEVKVLPLTVNGTTLDPFSPHAVAAGYPLFRPVHVAAAVDDSAAFDPLIDQFIRYVLSRDGQLDLIKDGYFPLSQEQLRRQEIKLGWEVLK
jgi:phosphate transport system substrate-binding protein